MLPPHSRTGSSIARHRRACKPSRCPDSRTAPWHVDDLAIIVKRKVWILNLDHLVSTLHATRSIDTAQSVVASESELGWHARGRGGQDETANGTSMGGGLRLLGAEGGQGLGFAGVCDVEVEVGV